MTDNTENFNLVSKVQSEPMSRASFSRLEYYNNCPLAFKYKYVDKIAPLSGPEQYDKDGNVKPPAWQRGSIIHQAMDDYINGVRDDLIPELKSLSMEINNAKKLKQTDPDRVLTEQNKYFDLNYELIDMDSLPEDQKTVHPHSGDIQPLNYHVLVIIDVLVFNEDFTEATVIDLKSGKRNNNEVKHKKQTQLYALFTSIEYPQVQNLVTQLWYCDLSGYVHQEEYTKDKILEYFNFWDRKVMQLLNDTDHLARPSEKSCFFCEYGLPQHSNKWVNKLGRCDDSKDKRYRE